MERLVVEGGRPLEGSVRISGAKNAALPLLAACLLTDETCTLRNVPDLQDVRTLRLILSHVGLEMFQRGMNAFDLTVEEPGRCVAPYHLVERMRASIYLLGPLVAKRGYAEVALPGGCVIGHRPVDLHLRGMEALGADLELTNGAIVARAPGGLRGAEMDLTGPCGSSVGATANVVMAACLAEGETVIHGAAREPDVTELIRFLNAMGARIEGSGSSTLRITGVETLHGAAQSVMPDRIEAATYAAAAALTGGDVVLEEVELAHMGAVVDVMAQAGVELREEEPGMVRVVRPGPLRAVKVSTAPYPGFPTDVQAQLLAMLTQAKGTSVVRETIYPERFMHVAELARMGAEIAKVGPTAVIRGPRPLSGAEVKATDLRAGAALVMAGLVAHGTTVVGDIHHIDRGYERIEDKLRGLGAAVYRETPSQTIRRAA